MTQQQDRRSIFIVDPAVASDLAPFTTDENTNALLIEIEKICQEWRWFNVYVTTVAGKRAAKVELYEMGDESQDGFMGSFVHHFSDVADKSYQHNLEIAGTNALQYQED